MSEQQWYFISVVNREQYGPYSADQLEEFVKGGSITRETMIWTAALEDQWIPASNVEGLFPSAQDPPPAAQPAQPARPQLLTGLASQGPQPSRGPLQPQPLQAAPLQAAPLQPAAAPLQPAAAPLQPAAAPLQPAAAPLQPAAAPLQPAAAPLQPAAAPLQPAAAPLQPAAAPLQPAAAPLQPAAAPLQTAAAPLQPAALSRPQSVAGRRPVAPGMIPSGMPGSSQQPAPAATPLPATALTIIPPGEPFPAPAPVKASFGIWLGLLSGSLVAMIFSFILKNATVAIAALPLLLWCMVQGLVYLHRAWGLIQAGSARTAPGKAIGLLLLPGFDLYWTFVAIAGLSSDWNRVVAAHPNLQQAPKLNRGSALVFCIGSLCIFFLVLFIALNSWTNWDWKAWALCIEILLATGAILLIPFMGEICKGINWMGSLHMTTGGGGTPSPLSRLISPGGAPAQAQQGGGGIHLY